MEENRKNINQKFRMKQEAGKIGLGLIVYQIILFLFVMGDYILRTFTLVLKSKDTSDLNVSHCLDQASSSGVGYLFAILVGIPVLFLFYKNLTRENIMKESKKISIKKFAMFLCVFMMSQLLFLFGSFLMEWLTNQMGYSILGEVDSASSMSTSFSMFLYASILGPVSEEVIFRGFILRTFEKYGKTFAIITSSILFGLYHGNFIQGIFAVLVGLVLAYVTMEYSIKWAILLHIINNGLFGDVMLYFTGKLSEQTQNIVLIVFYIGFFLLGGLCLIKNLKFIKTYWNKNRTGGYRYIFTSMGIILFCILAIITACMGVEKIC